VFSTLFDGYYFQYTLILCDLHAYAMKLDLFFFDVNSSQLLLNLSIPI